MELVSAVIMDRPERIKDALKGKLLYRFNGGVQTEHLLADATVAASQNVEQGIPDDKGSEKITAISEAIEKVANAGGGEPMRKVKTVIP